MTPASAPSTPTVDYRHTSLRPAWDTIPARIRSAIGEAVGAPIANAAPPVSTGFTGAYAGQVTLATGRVVFVKASGPDSDHVLGALAQEARVLARLPDGIPAPSLVAHGDAGGWRFLVLDVVEGHLPGMPWTPDDLTSVHEACVAVARHGTPAPVGLTEETFAAGIAGDARIAETASLVESGEFVAPPGLPAWFDRRGGEIARLSRAAEQLPGGSLVHSDLRPDNLLVGPSGRATLLDWNWVCTGPAWLDFVGLLPIARWQGLDVDAWVSRSPLVSRADPDAIDALLASIAVYMLSSLDVPPPPGCTPEMRRHQRLMAQAFLEWLGHRRGWAG